MSSWFEQHLIDFEFSFVHDDVENCEFFVWVDEAEELGYFKNNEIGPGHGRKTRLMEKVQSKVKAKAKKWQWRGLECKVDGQSWVCRKWA